MAYYKMFIDVYKVVLKFFEQGHMDYFINITTITLITKIENVYRVGLFRLISCCKVLHKIISKVLSFRMKDVIGKVWIWPISICYW